MREEQKAAVASVRAAWRARLMRPIALEQAAALQDPGARGAIWVSRVTLPAPPEDDARQAIFSAIQTLEADERIEYARPNVANVHAQWTGCRSRAGSKDPEPPISEQAKYEALMTTVSNDLTVFYMHAGGFTVGSPVVARPLVGKLATLTKARCFSVQYRLSPQNPFPAALLDALVAYLSLLAPPEGSYHEAVPASSIVLAGDSSGLNLCLSLAQVLLQSRRANTKIRFHGREVCPDLPAGVAGLSGFVDLTLSLPSNETNYDYDIMLPSDPYHCQDRPVEPCWPANPPRGDIYCETSALCHPLVSPVNAPNWTGMPPMWLVCGEERVADGVKAIAQEAVSDGVVVQFEEYRSMPHIWHITMPKLPQARMVVERWAKACLQLREGTFENSAKAITAKSMEVIDLDVRALISLSKDQVRQIVREHRDQRRPYVRLTKVTARI